jgi:hypothetical protein
VLLVVLAGCGGGLEPRDESPLPGQKNEILGCASPGGVRLAYDPTPPGQAHHQIHPALDTEVIRSHLTRILGERSAGPVSNSGLDHFNSGAMHIVNGSRYGLEVALDGASIQYVGQTGIFPVKIGVVVLLFPFDVPNYFIASDRYALVARAHWRLVDAGSGRTFAEGDTEAKQTGVFGDLSRGWYFLGFLRTPGCLDPDSWEEIAEVLRPGAEEALATAVVIAAENALGGDVPHLTSAPKGEKD